VVQQVVIAYEPWAWAFAGTAKHTPADARSDAHAAIRQLVSDHGQDVADAHLYGGSVILISSIRR